DRPLLVRREPRERVGQAVELDARLVLRRGKRRDPLGARGNLEAASPPGRTAALSADVLGDREEPGELGARRGALPQAAVGVDEGLLHGVLGVLTAPQPAQAVAENPARVPLEERAELGLERICGQRTHVRAIPRFASCQSRRTEIPRTGYVMRERRYQQVRVCAECGGQLESAFRFCPWCA